MCCNLTGRSLKAKSPGSSPGNATKTSNKINRLKASAESPSVAFFVLVALWWHRGSLLLDLRGLQRWGRKTGFVEALHCGLADRSNLMQGCSGRMDCLKGIALELMLSCHCKSPSSHDLVEADSPASA